MTLFLSQMSEVIFKITFPDLIFFFLAALILSCGSIVVFSKNIVHSGFSLLGTFAGVAGLYGLLSANFVAAVQILVYAGGVLIVILFAIMLTRGIQDARNSNPSTGLIPAILIGLIVAGILIVIAIGFPWKTKSITEIGSTVPSIGHALLDRYLIPFEILSVLLLAVLIGAVMLVRKEIKTEGEKEVEE
jgi:NADH:ubiquinone oxidoreductase subunit 6 (subunit J)